LEDDDLSLDLCSLDEEVFLDGPEVFEDAEGAELEE
jgi:hypothetical protein